MNPARFDSFAEAYAPAVLAAVVDLAPHLGGRSAQEYALGAALAMLAMIEAQGIESVEHYILNTRGGAFRRVADELQIDPSVKSLQHYLEG